MPDSIQKICVLGAGAWGSTLADLSARAGRDVALWDPTPETLERIAKDRTTPYVPELSIHERVRPEADFETAIRGKDAVLIVAPSQAVEGLCSRMGALAPELQPRVLVLASKGIDIPTRRLLSDVAAAHLKSKVAVLSGPCIAREVARRIPTSVVVALEEDDTAAALQAAFSTAWFRVYRQRDVRGVELGGALKNVIAIGAGASDGLGFGDNSKAALLCRGLAEMTRLSEALGADGRTLSGLSGLGDLSVTCFSPLSRNRRFGELLAKGHSREDALTEIGQVVEGIPTSDAALELANKVGVDTPIIRVVHEMCIGKLSPRDALASLMSRELKIEF